MANATVRFVGFVTNPDGTRSVSEIVEVTAGKRCSVSPRRLKTWITTTRDIVRMRVSPTTGQRLARGSGVYK